MTRKTMLLVNNDNEDHKLKAEGRGFSFRLTEMIFVHKVMVYSEGLGGNTRLNSEVEQSGLPLPAKVCPLN